MSTQFIKELTKVIPCYDVEDLKGEIDDLLKKYGFFNVLEQSIAITKYLSIKNRGVYLGALMEHDTKVEGKAMHELLAEFRRREERYRAFAEGLELQFELNDLLEKYDIVGFENQNEVLERYIYVFKKTETAEE